jgi:hypothetical protein
MIIVLFVLVEVVLFFYLALALSSYLEMLSAYQRNRCSKRPRFWRWILPIPGNTDWFYH